MKKKALAALLAAAMTASLLAGCGDSTSDSSSSAPASDSSTEAASTDAAQEIDYGSGEITIWVADAMVDLTKELAEGFLADNGMDYTVSVEAVGEGDAAKNMLTDVEGGADIYGFAQDQLARLVSAGALQPLNDNYKAWATESNDAGSVGAATSGDMMYAFPMTSDNGYFLYYDSSVISDPTSLEQIIADCEAAGKGFYFDMDSAWYNAAFFFATGAECTFDTDNDGNFVTANVSYASDAGVVAMKAMKSVVESSAFVDGSNAAEATNLGAIVDGVWDKTVVQEALGDNYACAKLPSFTGADGATYQLSGFGGFKLLGIKPQTEAGKLMVCYALAQYLTDTDAQMARFNAEGWGPSNLAAQGNDAITADPALSALAEQLAYTIPQGNYPGEWWDLAGSLGTAETLGKLNDDASILAALQTHDDTCASYIQ